MPSQLTNQHRLNLLSLYITDLELEVDRLRKLLQQVCRQSRPDGASLDSSSCAELLSLIDDIRDEALAPLELDRIVPIDLRKMIEDVFRWQQRLESRPEARLILSLGCERANWFPVRLRHILQNLMANAIKYGDPEKGENRVNVAVRSIQGSYELRVTDNGVGMPETQMKHLLEPMHRVSEFNGTKPGVGLAVVKHLVEQSGGELAVGSGEGMGSCFVVTLPMFDQGDYLE
jgi:signal transduction histidine kinase